MWGGGRGGGGGGGGDLSAVNSSFFVKTRLYEVPVINGMSKLLKHINKTVLYTHTHIMPNGLCKNQIRSIIMLVHKVNNVWRVI